MKKLCFFLLFSSWFGFSQNFEKSCKTIQKINTILQEGHYRPKALNDSLSVALFTDFLQALDPEDVYFLQPEIDNLKKHQKNIDDYIISSKCNFLEDIFVQYTKGIQRNLQIVQNLSLENLGTETKDTLIFSKERRPSLKNEAALQKLLKKRIVFDIYEDIAKSSKNKDSLVSNFPKLLASSKKKILENQLCTLQNLIHKKNLQEDFEGEFYKAFCAYFDPHTTYFSSKDRNGFITALNSNENSLGILFEINDKEEYFVTKVISGTIAYLDDKISVGDQILQFETKNESIAINCSTLEKLENLLNDTKTNRLQATFRKKDGTIFTSTLEKSKIKNFENTTYSLVVNDGSSNFGYLKIPSFYFDEYGDNPVSNHVFKELFKLKENQIKGLIIDLEFNGGGSIDECIKLLGMFLDYGPVAVVSNKGEKPTILKDYNKGIIYSDPIVVLVNGISASASEFFANTLKDYQRAIILGNTTYGKGSMQSIMPLDQNAKNPEFIKLTTEKFYQITGQSNQSKGVLPDCTLPSLFENIFPKEKDEKYALRNDTLAVNLTYKKFPSDYSSIITSSKARVAKEPYFNSISEINKKIDAYFNTKERKVYLKFKNVFDEIHALDTLYLEIEKMRNTELNTAVQLNNFDLESTKFDSDLKSDFETKIKEAKTNAALLEATRILKDILNTSK